MSRVLEAVRRHPYRTATVALGLVAAGVVTGVIVTRGEGGRPIGSTQTQVERFTDLIQKWLCDCGFAVGPGECKNMAEEIAYSVGPPYAQPPAPGEIPDGWLSKPLWSQCPTESERVQPLDGQGKTAVALNNVGFWAESHKELWAPATNGGQAVMVQWLMLIAALAIHTLLQG
ncbi:hypothetical protein [Variovorax sp. RA8]|uniref:hypothetical protein n=1 Tax=Variovorax sp. (strain JCM 16519 / RA8) TaxID=662548 RepID=UPI000B0AC36B|nr:hypothetical protein [Variovorax sp. RA8]